MWKIITKNLQSLVKGRRSDTIVGGDKFGNVYVERIESNGIRRLVEYKGDYDPKNIPTPWASWLNYSSAIHPTPEYMQIWEEEQKERKIKIKGIEAKESEKLKNPGLLLFTINHIFSFVEKVSTFPFLNLLLFWSRFVRVEDLDVLCPEGEKWVDLMAFTRGWGELQKRPPQP
eukprot:TRINITY_DN4718_c0_g1_i4.p1 TRINITY_DN4718_c0_g1~~TRINITY_DN4718_c0_g1_i4.p1  ORF type:complete len:173 (-),score=34.31 TRINITY_DN4718_c0_g1_i4:664-1182(-)